MRRGAKVLSAMVMALVTGCGLTVAGILQESPEDAGATPEAGRADRSTSSSEDVIVPVDGPIPEVDAEADGADGDASSSDADAGTDAADAADAADADSGSLNDAAPDAPADAGFDGNYPPLTSFKCGDSGTVSSCTSCAGAPVACVYCGLFALAGRCVAEGTSCRDLAPIGFGLCPCASSTDPSMCPSSMQVCRFSNGSGVYRCRTCGESSTDTLTCKGGGTCDEDAGACN